MNVTPAVLGIGVVIAIGREQPRRAGETDLRLAEKPGPS
jgi:hypothetical protein